MKKLYIFAALLAALGCAPSARAESLETTSHIVIAAIQTGAPGAPGDDYAVLHNDADDPVDITGWKLQYRAAGSTGTAGWSAKRTFACGDPAPDCRLTIAAHGNLVAATFTMPDLPTQKLSSGFSDVGGQIRLVQPLAGSAQLVTVDMVGYGTAAEYEGEAPAAAPAAGQVLGRKANIDGELIDTGYNSADFIGGCLVPTLFGSPVPLPCPQAQPVNEDGPPPVAQPITQPEGDNNTPATYSQLFITELLPDPASPALDSKDEFIELYNPTGQAVPLSGYALDTGPDFKYHFTLGDAVIAPGGYYAVFANDSHLSLTNTGTAVRLRDPAGAVQDTVASYGQAKTGQSWIKTGNTWQWSVQPTPGAQNIAVAEPPKAAAIAATTAGLTAKKPAAPAAKKLTVPTVKATKATAASKVAAAKTPKAAQPAQTEPPKDTGSAINYIVLGVAALGLLGYACYEYRQNIGRLWLKVRQLGRQRNAAPAEPTLQTD